MAGSALTAYDFADGNQRGVLDNGTVIYRWDVPQQDFQPISGAGGRLLKS